jgi:hypothetical protein
MHLCPLQYDQSLSPERASQIRVGWHMVVRARVPVTSYGIPLKPTPAMRSPQPRTREWFFRRFSRAVWKLTRFGASHPTGGRPRAVSIENGKEEHLTWESDIWGLSCAMEIVKFVGQDPTFIADVQSGST